MRKGLNIVAVFRLTLRVLFLLTVSAGTVVAAPAQLIESVLFHENTGSEVVFNVPAGARSVALQGWVPRSQAWVQISSRRAPKDGESSFRVPKRWRQGSLQVVATSRAGETRRISVEHEVVEEGCAIRFVAAQDGARLYSIEVEDSDSSGWERICTVAAPAEGSPSLRVALPSSVPADSHLRVVAVCGSDTGNLISPLAERLSSGPAFFGGSVSPVESNPDGSFAESFSKEGDDSSREGAASAVSRSDVWSLRGSRIYFFNQLRGLQIIDVSDRQSPSILGQLNLPAVGEEMYLLGGDGQSAEGALLVARATWQPGEPEFTRLLRVGVAGDQPLEQSELEIPGYYVESRMSGNMLHVVTTAWEENDGEWFPRTWLTSLDLSSSGAITQSGQTVFDFSAAQVGATARYLWIAGYDNGNWTGHRLLAFPFLLNGTLGEERSVLIGGVINDKFKVGDVDGGLAAVVQSWWTPDGVWQPVAAVETFADEGGSTLLPRGRLELVRDEYLFGTRFDGSRLYAVTYHLVDPLWLVDLSDPAAPSIAGTLQVPGWSSFIEPLGDVLLAVGREDGRVQVSLFDVANPAEPLLAQRIYLGSEFSWSEAEWDERAVSVLREAGLILLPVAEQSGGFFQNKVALVDFDSAQRSLRLRGAIAHDFEPRRASLIGEQAIASLSNRELLLVDASNRDLPVVTAEVALAFGAEHIAAKDGYVYQLEGGRRGAAGDAGLAVMRVAPASDPSDVVFETRLGKSGVAAAAVFGDRLCVVENDIFDAFAWTLSGADVQDVGGSALLSVWSLADASSPALVGRVPLRLAARGEVELLEVAGGRIAVADRISRWFLRSPSPVTSAKPASSAGDARMISPWFGYDGPALSLEIADVSGDAPVSVGFWSMEDDDISGVSRLFSAGDLLAFSFVRSSSLETFVGNHFNRSGVAANSLLFSGWPAAVRRTSLQILDLADPTSPMPWAPVEIPGDLVGIAWLQRGGGVLFCKTGEAQDRVAALGFDGERASLSAEVEVGYGPVATSGLTLFAASEEGVREWIFSEEKAVWKTGAGWSFTAGYGPDGLQPVDGALLASRAGDIWALLEDGSVLPAQTAGIGDVYRAAQTANFVLLPAGDFGTISLSLPRAE